ncbi:unnamed protein product [marine sediment metagenome]|uniref:Uncharacterized protein n=1 Tax=marine sediment metagenome TaxID=412755 RepID=X1L2G0_9ZZZZ
MADKKEVGHYPVEANQPSSVNAVESPKKHERLHSELVSATEHPVPEKPRGRPSPRKGETYFCICG